MDIRKSINKFGKSILDEEEFDPSLLEKDERNSNPLTTKLISNISDLDSIPRYEIFQNPRIQPQNETVSNIDTQTQVEEPIKTEKEIGLKEKKEFINKYLKKEPETKNIIQEQNKLADTLNDQVTKKENVSEKLSELLENIRDRERAGLIFEGLSQIGSGFASRGLTKPIEYDKTFAREYTESGRKNLRDYIASRERLIEEEQEKRRERLYDPNSPESKIVQDSLKKIGINYSGSAGGLKDAGFDVDSLLARYETAKENRLSRELTARMMKEEKLDKEKREIAAKSYDAITKNKGIYEKYQNATLTLQSVENAISNPNATRDYENVIGFLKSLDNSVVREGEFKNFMNAQGLSRRIEGTINQITGRRMVDARTMKEIRDIIKETKQNLAQAAKNRYAPIIRKNDKLGIDRSFYIPDDILPLFEDVSFDKKNENVSSYKKNEDVSMKKQQEEEVKPTGKEIRRLTKDGRIAVFDENKRFLRYE